MERKSNSLSIVTGILFIFLGIVSSIPLFFAGRFDLGVIANTAGMFGVAISMFTKNKITTIISFGLLVLGQIITMTGASASGISYSGWSLFSDIIGIVGWLLLLLMTVANDESVKKKLFKVQIVALIINVVVVFFSLILYNAAASIVEVLISLLGSVVFLMPALCIIYPYGFPRSEGGNSKAYCSIGKHIVLLLFTCGIWLLVWIYRVTDYLNCVYEEPPRNPASKLLLNMFVPFYSIYWLYKSGQLIDILAVKKGVQSNIAGTCLVLGIFFPFIAYIIIQDKINAIINASEFLYTPAYRSTYSTAENTSASTEAGISANTGISSSADEIRKFKDLLDSGVITQEEFDAKKKQLLGF